jgi:long-chain acyl-CoA synthetase
MPGLLDALQQHAGSMKPYAIDSRWTVSYDEMIRLAAHNADILHQAGVGQENLGLLCRKSVPFAVGHWSVVAAGACIVPLDPAQPNMALSHDLGFCDCRWLVYPRAYRDKALPLARESGVGLVELQDDLTVALVSTPRGKSVPRENSSEVVVLMQTSGTTQRARRVMLTSRNLLSMANAHAARLDLRPDDKTLIVLPCFHISAYASQFLTHTYLGGSIMFYDQPTVWCRELCRRIGDHGITTCNVVPTLLHLLDRYRYLRDHRVECLRYLCCGGDRTPVSLLQSIMVKLPSTGVVVTYGLTECSARATELLPCEHIVKSGSVGRTIPGVNVRIVREDGTEAACGEVGEIHVHGPNVASGYYKDPVANRAVFCGGWLSTGDTGWIDPDGFLYIAGRQKMIIISSGVNIHPEEVEEVMKRHPRIQDVLVMGEADELSGQRVVAHVVTTDGQPVSVAEVHEVLAGKLIQSYWPHKVVLVKQIPRTPSGKLRRSVIQA